MALEGSVIPITGTDTVVLEMQHSATALGYLWGDLVLVMEGLG